MNLNERSQAIKQRIAEAKAELDNTPKDCIALWEQRRNKLIKLLRRLTNINEISIRRSKEIQATTRALMSFGAPHKFQHDKVFIVN